MVLVCEVGWMGVSIVGDFCEEVFVMDVVFEVCWVLGGLDVFVFNVVY